MKQLLKLPYEYILFFLQILFIALFVLVLLGYNLDVAAKSFLKSRMFSDNVQGIVHGDPRVDKSEDIVFKIPEANADYVLYKELDEGFEIKRGIYAPKDIFGLEWYLGEGRFFTNDDYTNKTETAVIGEKIRLKTFEENGKRWLHYGGRAFEVIGVFKETGSDLDSVTYFNLTALMETEKDIAQYYIDAKSSETVQKVVDAFAENATARNFKLLLTEYESPLIYVGLSRGHNTMLVTAVGAAMLNLLITVTFFVTRKKYKVAVQKLYGMTNMDLAVGYGKSIFVVMVMSFLSVVLVITCLSRYMGSLFTLERLAVWHFVIMGGCLVVLGIAVVFFIVRLAGKVNISDSLKGR